MIFTWICVITIFFNVCQVESVDKADGATAAKSKRQIIKDAYITNSKRFIKAIRKSPKYLRTFLMWFKKYIRHGIKCLSVGIDQVKCQTKDGLSIKISMKNWNRIPKLIKPRLGKTVQDLALYFRKNDANQ